MIDSLVVSGDCKDLDYAIIDGSGAGTAGNLVIKDFAGVIPTITTAVTFAAPGDTTTGTVTLGGNGVFEVQWDVAAVLTDANGLVVHCDIDCCLAALTRELVECDCNCAKCSKALAKAQKIFLLLNSAQRAASLLDITSYNTGYLQDAYDKYNTAKDICDLSCGCDC